MTPTERYQHDLSRAEFQPDEHQARAVAALQRVYDDLLRQPPSKRTGVLGQLKKWVGETPVDPVKGLYLWGGVGRGKTWLMDCFFDSLPGENKLREHFHSFMQRVHYELKQLKSVEDPLASVASKYQKQIRILCLDEFHVADIADAMLLGRLMGAFFDRGIVLVTTSNTQPDDLYKDGLQRERFLPAIASIKANNEVLELAGETDFRLRTLEKAEIYLSPCSSRNSEQLMASFLALNPEHVREGYVLRVLGREIQTIRYAEDVVWFDFDSLCTSPRAAPDYIEIGRRFNTVIVDRIPQMSDDDNDQAQRFIQLIDEFYDRNVILIACADARPDTLYCGKRLKGLFKRTRSRLEEMQTRHYLSRVHLS